MNSKLGLNRREAIALALGLPLFGYGCGQPRGQASDELPLPMNDDPDVSAESTCKLDPARLETFLGCLETSGMDDNAPNEWPWNVLSKRTVAYECGQIARNGLKIEHKHDADEVALCQKLSASVKEVVGEIDVGMGSESSDPFRTYFRVIPTGDPVPKEITIAVIRDAFGGAIYPPTAIVIEPLKEAGEWWRQVFTDGDQSDEYLKPWRKMVKWFHEQPELRVPAFVMIGEDPLDPVMANGGCVFPRMAVALTRAGSLVGIGGWVVHT